MSDIFLGLRNSEVNNGKCSDDSSSTATDSFVDSFVGMVGGNEKIPNCGYPPIQLCQDKSIKEKPKSRKELKKREFSNTNDKKNLSIHQILDDRRKKPIFEL